jgi:hypothetical protein
MKIIAAEGAETLTSFEPCDIASKHVLTTNGILNNISTIYWRLLRSYANGLLLFLVLLECYTNLTYSVLSLILYLST